jgi:cytoskeleton protein RodZ
MMQAHHPEARDPDQKPSPSIGQQLRQARLNAGLSEEEVAAQLRLDRSVIRQLEGDEYQKLPAPTYVRGYLRSYARLVSVPPGPIVELFNRHNLPAPKLAADAAHRRESTASDWPMRLMTWGFVSGLIILIAVWLRNQELDVPYAAGSQSAVPEVTELHAGMASSRQVDAPPSSAAKSDVSPKPDSEVTDVAQLKRDTPHAQDTATNPEPRLVVNGQLPRSKEGPEALPDSERGPTPSLASRPSSAEHHPRQGVTAHKDHIDHIKMHFNHDSWVEVYGQEQKRLYYGLVKAGEALNLSGAGPFRVLLGYAWDVDIEYNDKPFDHSPYIQSEGLARFALGTTASSPHADRDVPKL